MTSPSAAGLASVRSSGQNDVNHDG